MTGKTKSIARKSYSELITFNSFEDRFDYLKLPGTVGSPTFGSHRYINQRLYQSRRWKSARREVILRDDGCDLACSDYPIYEGVYIHHINPISLEDILKECACVFDPENLICVSFRTHNALHYSSKELITKSFIARKKNDTCPWR